MPDQQIGDLSSTIISAFAYRAANGIGVGVRLAAFNSVGLLIPSDTDGGTQDLDSVLTVGNSSALAVNLTGNKTTTWHQSWGNFIVQQHSVNNVFLSDNVYYDGGAGSAKLKATGAGSMVYFIGGGIQFRTIASGAAGDAVTMNTRWNLANDGEMTAYRGLSFSLETGTNRDVKISNVNSSTDNLGNLTFYPTSGTNVGAWYDFIPRGTGYGSTFKSGIRLWNTDYAADSTNFEGLTLSSAGTAGYVLNSIAAGTGTVRPIHFQIATTDALLIAADRKITFNNDYTFPLSSGAANQVLAMPASGTQLVWATPSGGSGMTNPMTTAGDLIVGGVSGAPGRLGIGSANTYLKSNGSVASWGNFSSDVTTIVNNLMPQTAKFYGTTTNFTEIDLTGTMAMPTGESGYLEVNVAAVNAANTGTHVRKYIIPYRVNSSSSITFETHTNVVPITNFGSADLTGSDSGVASNGSGGLRIPVVGVLDNIAWEVTVLKYKSIWSA